MRKFGFAVFLLASSVFAQSTDATSPVITTMQTPSQFGIAIPRVNTQERGEFVWGETYKAPNFWQGQNSDRPVLDTWILNEGKVTVSDNCAIPLLNLKTPPSQTDKMPQITPQPNSLTSKVVKPPVAPTCVKIPAVLELSPKN